MIDALSFQRPLALLVLIPLVSMMVYRFREEAGSNFLQITRLMVMAVAVLAIANPSVIIPEVSGQKTVTLLQDQSDSSQIIQRQPLDVPGVEIREREFSGNTPQQTTKALISTMEEDTNYLISSDFQLAKQKLSDELEEKNVTLYALKQDTKKEYAVSIEGPDETYLEAENKYQVEIDTSTADKPLPDVTVEGNRVSLTENEEGYSFNYTFDSEGTKKIKAEISNDDQYNQNNRFYHVVDVRDKPDILYVGERVQGSHNSLLDQSFSQEAPDSLDNYDTVVTNSEVPSRLKSEIISGQSVLHTGPLKEREYLPLKPTEQGQSDESTFDMARVVIVIDISVSNTEDIRNNKAIALNAVDGLSASSQVAVVAYNDNPYLLSELRSLQNNREELKNTIKSIETKGPTDHAVGLKAGEDALNGQGNMIMITDGGLKTDAPGVENVKERTLREAANSSLRINVVDSKPSVNPEFLQEVAQLTDGIYSSTGTEGPLSFVFDSQEASGRNMITTVDRTHPVTRQYSSTVFRDIPGAEEKEGAQTLMRSEQGTPYLSVWRYGIGKVAAINDQQISLSSLTSQDPQIVLNTLQWLSSGGEDNKTVFEGTRMPESTYVSSSGSFEGSNRLSRNRYVKTFDFNQTGFKNVAGSVTAYNYPLEKQKIGYSDDMNEVVSDTGGEVLEEVGNGQIDQIANRGTSKDALSLENHLLAILLVLLLIEIGVRKRKRMM